MAGLLALSGTAQAQQSTKIPRIGLLTGQSQASSASGPNIDAFRQGLREFGYIEGKNIVVEYRGAAGKLDRLTELAAELVALGVDIIVTTGMPPVQDPNHFVGAYAEMTKRSADALIIFTSSFTSFHRRELLELANKNRLPTMCAQVLWMDAGCFMSYGPSPTELYRRAAYFVDKILKGTKPADLPVERPRKYVNNLGKPTPKMPCFLSQLLCHFDQREKSFPM
ncbi:MAG: ABC transporter substrate-binding protein [Candidatus Binatia bacterium]